MNASVVEELRAKLVKHLGQEPAERILQEAYQGANLMSKPSYSPQEILSLGEQLVRHGGYIALVGRSLRVKALLSGATTQLAT